MIRKIVVTYFVIFGLFSKIYSQKCYGVIRDTMKTPLQNASIIAEPFKKESSLKYAITDHLGRYKLLLDLNEKYTISISHLGHYEKKVEIFVNFKKLKKDFTLKKKNRNFRRNNYKIRAKSDCCKKRHYHIQC